MKKLAFVLGLILITELSFGQWTKEYFVDEFGDTTKNAFMGQRVTGTFSNTATIDSELTVDLILFYHTYENERWPILEIRLYEYNRGPAVTCRGAQTLKVKTSDDSIHKFHFYLTGIHFKKKAESTVNTDKKTKSELRLEQIEKEMQEEFKKLGLQEDEEPLILLDLLKKETSPMKFYIRLNDSSTGFGGPSSEYNFIVNPEGFSEVFNSL